MPPSLPLHSILLPRRFIHVDDKRNSLLAGCGPYVDRFDLSLSPVLRARLGVFTSDGEDVEGLVQVKDTPHFVAFSRTRLALLHEDNLKNGGIVADDQISKKTEFLDGIRQFIEAQLVKGKLEVVVLTSSALQNRKMALAPFSTSGIVGILEEAVEEDPLVSATWDDSTSTAATLRSSGRITFSICEGRESENPEDWTARETTVPNNVSDKAMLMASMPGNKIFVVTRNLMRYIHVLTDKDGELSSNRETIVRDEEKKEGVLPILIAFSQDYNQVVISYSDKSIEYAGLDFVIKKVTNGKKDFISPSPITSLAISGKGTKTVIYYGTESGEIGCIPVAFFVDNIWPSEIIVVERPEWRVSAMEKLGHDKNVYALTAKGSLHRVGQALSEIFLREAVDMERVLALTTLPSGDLLVCGIREGVVVGVSLSSLRLLFSLSHRQKHFNPAIEKCLVTLKDNTFRIAALTGQTVVMAEEPWYGEKTLIVERPLHSAKIVAHTSVYIGFGTNEKKSSDESGHALVTASDDGHVVISSLWNNGRLVPLHRFRVPGVNCLAAFSYASQRCASCVKAETACIHRKGSSKPFRCIIIAAGTRNGRLYLLSLDAASLSDPRVVDRPSTQRMPRDEAVSSVHIATRPSLHGLVRATLFLGNKRGFRGVEVSAIQKVKAFEAMQSVRGEEEIMNNNVRSGLVVMALRYSSMDDCPLLRHPLVHPSTRELVGLHATVVSNRLVYTSGSRHSREGSLIGTKDGRIFLWGIVEKEASREKRKKAASAARRGDETRLPSEDSVLEEKKAKWGVITEWTPPSKDNGEVVALSSTLSPSSAATTIAALFSTGMAAVFLLALDKLVFVEWLETKVKDPVGISVVLQGTDNLNSRCSTPYPSSAVVSGGNSIEVAQICQVELRKAIEKIWSYA